MSSRSNGGRNQNTGSSESSPRWWRWRRQSLADTPPLTVTAAAPAADESWSLALDRVYHQIAPYLPPFSAATRKAILCMVALVIAWKFVIWTLELVVTGACFSLAVSILLCFLRPDAALWIVTQVLPPYVDEVREWLSRSFMRAGQSLDRGPPGTSSLPLTAPSPLPYPTPRSPRTTVTRALPEAALVLPANA